MLRLKDNSTHNKLFFAASSIIAGCVSLFIAYKNSKFDMIYSDAISDNNLLRGDFVFNDISIQALHTHILKWPVVYLENLAGFNLTTHMISSMILILVMNLLLCIIFYRVSRGNLLATSIGLLMLVSVELMFGINAGEGSLTMITIRNIEIPILIGATMFFFNKKNIFSWSTMLVSAIIGFLFLSDKLPLYTAIIGLVIFFIVNLLSLKSVKRAFLQDVGIYSGMLFSTLFYLLASVIVSLFGIFDFFTMKFQNNEGSLVFAGGAVQQFDIILHYIEKFFDVFGAGFFAMRVADSWVYIINLPLALVGAAIIYRYARHGRKLIRNRDTRLIFILLCIHFFAMLIFTIVIPREIAGRYFAAVPVITIMVILMHLREISFHQVSPKYRGALLAFAPMACAVFFGGAVVKANELYYRPAFAERNITTATNQAIANHLMANNVSSYISIYGDDRAFWDSHIIKQMYDESTGKSLALSSVFCGGSVVDKNFSRKSWNIPDSRNVAIREKGCNINNTVKIFGKPKSITPLTSDTDVLMIYNHDVRDKLNLIQYETDLFIKK